MSNVPGGPQGPEIALAGAASGGLRGAVGRYRQRRGLTSAAQTSLKFDIQGLNDFKTGIRNLRNEIGLLRGEFRSLTRDTDAWVASLNRANQAMRGMNRRGVPGVGSAPGGGHSGGVKGGTSSITMPAASQMALPGMGTAGTGDAMAGAEMAGTAAMGPAAIAAMVAKAVGGAVQTGVNMAVNRWQGLQQTGAAYDVYGSRLAVTTGIGSARMAGMLSRSTPFYGGAADIGQALTTLAAQGAAFGGRGIAGQSGAAGAQGVQMLQQLMPGLNAVQGAQTVASFQTNVSQQRMGTFLFGQAARSITPEGRQKSLAEIFNGIFKQIQNNRQGRNRGRPYSREEWTAMRSPGSAVQIQLSQFMGWNDEQINDFFTYAEAQSVSDPTGVKAFQGTDQEMRQVRGGERSLATEVQKTETRQGQADLAAYNQNAGSMIGQQEANRAMIGLQQVTNQWLGKIFQALSYLPGSTQGGLGGLFNNLLSGNFGGAAMTGFNMIFGGDYGYGDIGDAGLSQLNPDLRGRLGAMMAANPNLQLNSGYRTANQQRRLYDGGHPNMAPPGKSRHGRGQAADLGPRSQLGWINANARRFGLDTGADKGEPWHVQVAGTMIGDVGTEADAVKSFREGSAAARSSAIESVAQALVKGSSGSSQSASGGSNNAAPTGTPTSGTVGVDAVLKALYAAGFRGQDLIDMAAIPARESHYKTDTHNDNAGTQDNSYGLWQINLLPNANGPLFDKMFPGQDHSVLYDVNNAAKMAFAMYQANNSTLYPWGPYKGRSPTYDVPEDAINKARDTANSLWPGGYGDYGYGGGGGGGNYMNAPVFNMNFAIAVNGANGVDTNNLVRQIASKLEPQIRKMNMARR